MTIIEMVSKVCEFCGKLLEAKTKARRFCDRFCQRKHYYRRPLIKEKILAYTKEYQKTPEFKRRNSIRLKKYRQRSEVKERNRILALTKYKEKRREFWKEYGKRPEVRARIRMKENFRLHNDKQYAIADRLRRSLLHAMSKYSKSGKIMTSKKYGISWKEVIEHLKPFPENLNNFEIDHIIPLHTFDLDDPEEVKKAFSPSNLQWLTREENRKKSGKLFY
jgi:hypothetical protein